MSALDPKRLQAAFNEHEAELTLLRALVGVLVEAHPNKADVLAKFTRQIDGYCRAAPAGTDPEYVVEVRARMSMYLQLLA